MHTTRSESRKIITNLGKSRISNGDVGAGRISIQFIPIFPAQFQFHGF